MSDPVQFMSQMTVVEYRCPRSRLAQHIAEAIAEGRIIGHECPECSRVYVPPRGYCPLCSVPTGDADEVDIAAAGTITTFSVITPLQYQGQEEKDDYVQATILLDGSTRRSACSASTSPIATCTRDCASTRRGAEAERKLSGGPAGATSRSARRSRAGSRPANPTRRLEQYADYIV